MSRKLLPLVLAASVFAGTASGCTAGPQVGSVVVEVRAMAPDVPGQSYQVEVSAADGGFADSREVTVGSTITIENVPYGWVSVAAASSCTVEGQLESEAPTLRLIIDGTHCTLSN